ncbi:MAG: ATP-binding cassette domain-containing protein [Lachnospiraceae bacterium]
MLQLTDIKKNYLAGENEVHALKGINLTFREHEFVSILGPSGCGKTTLLNIIGGLDHYTSGDLSINGISTKEYTDRDWDTYRNHTIGFVFQNYNLIPHQTVLSNVELALTLSGVSKEERRKKAIDVLNRVGLGDQIYKKPNQMSGGQMQRVAIARALVNDPDILLADEPTGALDTETSVQIMEILKEIAETKLVIMVTHNPELADSYSTRIIRLLDGKITDDTMPITSDEIQEKSIDTLLKNAKTSMSFITALSLSLNNLMTKKARTFLIAFAGSIGIIGIALILSLSNGIQNYIDSIEENTLSSYPITVQKEVIDMSSVMESMMGIDENVEHDMNKVYSKNVVSQAIQTMMSESTVNNLSAFKTYLDTSEDIKNCTNAVQYTYNVKPLIYLNDTENVLQVNPFDISGAGVTIESTEMQSMHSMFMSDTWVEMIDNQALLESQYELVAGKWASGANECVLVVNEKNEIFDLTLYALGLADVNDLYAMFFDAVNNIGNKEEAQNINTADTAYSFDDILGLSYKLVLPTDMYEYDETTGTYVNKQTDDKYVSQVIENAFQVKLVGIIRVREDAVSTTISPGTIAYTHSLTEYYINEIQTSNLVKAQIADKSTDVITGLPFDDGSEIIYTNDEKTTLFNEYVNGLSTTNKAALFLKIYTAPSDEELDAMVTEFIQNYPDRASKQSYAIETMITMIKELKNGNLTSEQLSASGFDSETLEYLTSLSDDEIREMMNSTYTQFSDEEFNQMFLATIKESMRAMYSEQLASSFDSYSNEELADMLITYLQSKTPEETGILFDNYMPSMVSSSSYDNNMTKFGLCYLEDPQSINIFAKSFEDKEKLQDLINEYNQNVEEKDKITYTDYVGLMMSSITSIVDIVSYVLIAFVSISLVVSSIMIGIITYISVLERTKEIGILRSIGASKKDISRVFNAEAITIGFVSGFIGIMFTILINIPINIIIKHLTDVSGIASLPPVGGIILVLISMFLTFIAGLIPSRIAAKKDPVLALRSE